MRSDQEIQHDVVRELEWDSRIDPTQIGVTVRNGIVTFNGVVSRFTQKAAAADAALRVEGVHDVANDLVVEIVEPPPGDRELAEAVRHALRWDVVVPEDAIRSTVSNGLVTLMGAVDHATQRDDAARAVGAIRGVIGVDNLIEVVPWNVTPSAIRDELGSVGPDVEIDVHGSRVTLTGKVASGHERDVVLGATWRTPGVEDVVDHLVVK